MGHASLFIDPVAGANHSVVWQIDPAMLVHRLAATMADACTGNIRTSEVPNELSFAEEGFAVGIEKRLTLIVGMVPVLEPLGRAHGCPFVGAGSKENAICPGKGLPFLCLGFLGNGFESGELELEATGTSFGGGSKSGYATFPYSTSTTEPG
jgi:hypothetical protein